MDEDHLIAAIRYVSLNPVRARLVGRPQDWPWSSVAAHLRGRNDGVVTVAPVLARVGDVAAFLGETFDAETAFAPLRRGAARRPAGRLARLDRTAGTRVRPPAGTTETRSETERGG
jgi:putative transposase